MTLALTPYLADLLEVVWQALEVAHREKARLIVGIDGPCASGKSALAEALALRARAAQWTIQVIHLDDFFWPLEKRPLEADRVAGENFERPRFIKEVWEPLLRGEKFYYRPYSCKLGQYLPGNWLEPGNLNLIEGTYCGHPALRPAYDFYWRLKIEPKIQRERILARNGPQAWPQFRDRWLPLEALYFSTFRE